MSLRLPKQRRSYNQSGMTIERHRTAIYRFVQIQISLLSAVLIFAVIAFGRNTKNAADASAPAAAISGRVRGTVFRDCPDCPEMEIIPAGNFMMGSSESEKAWAASHGASAESVSDEAPQHHVTLKSFALGKYDVTRAEYAAFVRETGYPPGDGCGKDSFKWNKQQDLNWKSPGYNQTDRDPVVCISWQDARAYVAWLNNKGRGQVSTSGDAPYRLPSEAEWEYAARAGTTTRFWWGDNDDGAVAHAWYKDNSDGKLIRPD